MLLVDYPMSAAYVDATSGLETNIVQYFNL
jgi:hypothetical protein